jgi:hypothetical protein
MSRNTVARAHCIRCRLKDAVLFFFFIEGGPCDYIRDLVVMKIISLIYWPHCKM